MTEAYNRELISKAEKVGDSLGIDYKTRSIYFLSGALF